MSEKCKLKGKYAENLCDSLAKKYTGVSSATVVSYASGAREVLG